MVKSTEMEIDEVPEATVTENKVEKTIETVRQNTSTNEQIVRLPEKGSKEASDEDGEHGD